MQILRCACAAIAIATLAGNASTAPSDILFVLRSPLMDNHARALMAKLR